ncbi:MAG: hypothetical protein CYPHOPRED_004519 [Cyphobasidiales sp. Tagirdzhanova-0007]|nr:MAG: hypothetical protein CYPHOPRED_004519 [Cyphobasidiales sp. Tagirdzhanova-0007]
MEKRNVTFVLVPGAWHDPDIYYAVGKHLEAAGYRNVYVSHPSVNCKKGLDDPYADVKNVQRVLKEVLDNGSGSNVVLVAHSYGGMVITNAVEGFTKADREVSGQTNAVISLAYVTAFVLPKGKSLWETNGKAPCPETTFYGDIPKDQRERWSAALGSQSYNTFKDLRVDYLGYEVVPSAYLVCTEDMAIPGFFQEKMLADAKEGSFFLVERMDCSHSPFLSKIEETATFLRRTAGEVL